MLSASTRLQSRQPHFAPRQFSATVAIVAGGEKYRWRWKMLQTSGLPGSFRVTRAGSVLAGRSFCQISSGESSSPMVLPRLFDILAWPSRPMIRFASVSSGLGLREVVRAIPELGVPPARDLPGQLEVLGLVLAHRHEIGPVEQDIRGHQHGVIQQPRRHTFESLRLIFELRHPLELADRRDGVQQPLELAVLGHVRLHEQHRSRRIDAAGEQADRHLAGAGRQASPGRICR